MNINKYLDDLKIEYTCIGNTSFDTLGLAGANTEKSFCTFLADVKYLKNLRDNASIILVTEEVAKNLDSDGLCIVDNPRRTFFELHNRLTGEKEYCRPVFDNQISPSAKIDKLAKIADKNVVIGENTVIEEFVSIKENTVIGDNCIIRSGSIIGGEGFEFKRNSEGNLFGVKHVGGVFIDDDVEIQQKVCIDKAIYPWDDTRIGRHSKIDNLVHIAHAVKVGENTMIVANSSIGGRTIIGDNCWIGVNATLRNGLVVENNARVNMGAVATKNIEENHSVTGNFAIEHEQFIQNLKRQV